MTLFVKAMSIWKHLTGTMLKNGTVGGFNGLRALDFDGSTNTAFAFYRFKILGLPRKSMNG